jgi:hypothetical protein
LPPCMRVWERNCSAHRRIDNRTNFH